MRLITATCVCLGLCTFGSASEFEDFDSFTSFGLDTEIQTTLLSEANNEAEYRDEIAEQLGFLVGGLNARGAVADLGHARVQIEKIESDQDRFRVSYSAQFIIAWPRNIAIPNTLRLLLPRGGDETGLVEFFKFFSRTCSHDPNEPALNRYSFYYYFRPIRSGCALASSTVLPAIETLARLQVSAQNTSGKSPEYAKIWEDGRLVATLIYATDRSNATSPNDNGIAAYNSIYRQLLSTYGAPTAASHTLSPGALPGPGINDLELTFWVNGRTINVSLLLIDKLGFQQPTPLFAKRYNERSRISDFVSYNGHSDYGENIRALAKMGTFTAGQYQLYFINGCDTFAYIDDSLRLAHFQANPTGTDYQFLDIITNSLPAFFSSMTAANARILQALLTSTQTYRTLLSGIDPKQSAVVIGEQDNKR